MNVKKGQTVFFIEDNIIFEGKISWFKGNKEVEITFSRYSNNPQTVTRTYGVDFYLSFREAFLEIDKIRKANRQRADIVLQQKKEYERARKLEREQQRERERIKNLIKKQEERKREIEEKQKKEIQFETQKVQETKKIVCESCGLPIGNFGHCGCSY